MSETDRMPPRVKLALCLAASLAVAWIMAGCGSGGGGGSAVGGGVDPNAMSPAGVPVYLTPAVDADPGLAAALLAEIDTYGVPPRYLVVVYDTEMIPYRGPHYSTVHGYTSISLREIHAGRFAEAPFLRVIQHEVLHAACECWCVSGHLDEPRCQ